jgi:hypothetical protein
MATTSGVHSEDDDPALNDYLNDDYPSHGSMHEESPSDSKLGSQSLPMQKRRRVGRACDECRRKKIKCDGKQPCTHCTVYSYGGIFPSLLFPRYVLLASHVANIPFLPQIAPMTNPLIAAVTPPLNMSKLSKLACTRPKLFSEV